jgi:DNA-binding GntR family transcriptional regulator
MPKNTDTKTLVETAYRNIKQLMLQQKVAAGQKLLYRELVDWLHMSKTPIINAMNRLEQEGFVVSEANRGFYVKPMDVKEIMDCFEVREALEALAVRQAIQLATPANIEVLARKVEAYEAYTNHKYDKKKLMLNAEVHMHIAAMSNNQVLTYLLRRNLEHVILRLRLDNYPPGRLEISSHEHDELLSLIRQKNIPKSTALAHRHIRNACEHVIACVTTDEVDSGASLAFFEE